MNKSIKDIDDYLALQNENVRIKLEKLRQTIKKAVPEAKEVISYSMPAFKYHGMLAYFAAFKKHYSLFISPNVLESFKDDLGKYELAKATIRIPMDKPVPVQIVTKIIKTVAKVNLQKAGLMNKGKRM